MPRTPKLPRANARYWVEEAKLELRVANDYRNEPAMGLIRCARAHAATELAIKAVIIAHEKGYRDTHDIGVLLQRAEQIGERIDPKLKEAQRLTAYAGRRRYGHLEHPQVPQATSKIDVDGIVGSANTTVMWADERVRLLLQE